MAGTKKEERRKGPNIGLGNLQRRFRDYKGTIMARWAAAGCRCPKGVAMGGGVGPTGECFGRDVHKGVIVLQKRDYFS